MLMLTSREGALRDALSDRTGRALEVLRRKCESRKQQNSHKAVVMLHVSSEEMADGGQEKCADI
jgi:hypothetical protein